MSFNTRKCKPLRVTNKRNTIDFTYHIGNDALDMVPHLSSNLKWTNHVNNIVVKGTK